jgi:hypothetical protein
MSKTCRTEGGDGEAEIRVIKKIEKFSAYFYPALLPASVNPADLARYIATVLYGMAVQAAGGASRSKLQRVVEMALRTLPM